ncbi:conjugative transposon protein TraM [Maribacter sp. 2308TA10-17]|uniref:conjugative transposon protein TraM n=1 Tax=Maribacter sp. 2308TA10-17 TaxID=3386276 RepID=UPI0039BC91B2
MKIEKNKIVFSAVLAITLIFLVSYSLLIMEEEDGGDGNIKQTLVPELEQEQEDYKSKLEAIDALKKVRERNAPSIYDEKYLDSTGVYDPDLLDKEKERIVDSIYAAGRIYYSEIERPEYKTLHIPALQEPEVDSTDLANEHKTAAKELGLEHKLFFATHPIQNDDINISRTDSEIHVTVDGNQVVKANHRLRMRLTKDATINDRLVAKNTSIYGFIKFQPNRVLIEIENINHHPTKLKAIDFQDGSEGIYIENNFREEISNEVVDDILQDINIPSVPQISGIQKVFRRNNRSVRVTILNNYKLVLKPDYPQSQKQKSHEKFPF